MFRTIRFILTHGIALAIGFALGIYLLPILIEPERPSDAEVVAASQQAMFSARFRRDLEGSDFLHWGEGQLSITERRVSFMGKLAPGPDYRLYLTPEFVQTGEAFEAIKAQSVQVGHIKTFDNFIVDIPPGINPADYRGALVWCETFSMFITAAGYR